MTNNTNTKNDVVISKSSSIFDSLLFDPTRFFSILVITIMIIRHAERHDWDFTISFSTGFCLNPYVILFITMSFTCIYYGYTTRSSNNIILNRNDRWTAEWYWWNSWLFHMTMDGASGSLRLVPVVVEQYDILDLRFPERHVVPWIIGIIELFIMGPLCMILCGIIINNNTHSYRYSLELITSTLHITGMIVFVVSEVYEGQLKIPALDPVGIPGNMWGNVKFDFYHCIHYWFGFWFCNLIWGVVPLIRIRSSMIQCHNAFIALSSKQQQSQQKVKDENKTQ